jgi:plastocyanin
MTRSHKLHLFLLAAVALLVLPLLGIACGGDDDDDGGTSTAAATTPAGTGDGEDDGETTLDISMGDNFYELDGEKNPVLKFPSGAKVTINLTNDGTAIHNMRFDGEDVKFDTADDAASDPTLVTAGQTAVLEWDAPEAGAYNYRCDFHPTDMFGTIEVE